MSAAPASLKISYISLKVRNLSAFHSDFKQTDFLRSIPPIFLTLTSQGGNQGIAQGDGKKKEIHLREISTYFFHCPQIIGIFFSFFFVEYDLFLQSK